MHSFCGLKFIPFFYTHIFVRAFSFCFLLYLYVKYIIDDIYACNSMSSLNHILSDKISLTCHSRILLLLFYCGFC